MRRLKGIFWLAGVGFALWCWRHQLNAYLQARLPSWEARRSIEDSVRSTAYPITESRWLEFDIPPQAVGLRLLTNAAVSNTLLPPISPERPRRGWRYALDFQLLDDQGEPLQERRYHLRTRISRGPADSSENTEGPTWFRESPLVPARTRTIQIPLRNLAARPHRIRVRLGNREAQLDEVVMRLYFQYERPDYEQPYAWSRLSLDARRRLCRASVYPPGLVTPRERHNLLHWNWTALAPRGHPGVDYDQRLIYQRETPQPIDLEFLPPAEGVSCEPDQPVTMATPSASGVTQLEFLPDHDLMTRSAVHVDVRLHRKGLGVVAHHEFRVDDWVEPLRLETSGDLLEIVADDYLICAAQWWPGTSGDGELPLPLDSTAQTIRAQLIDPADPLEYQITHVKQFDTPLRISLRRLLPTASNIDSVTKPENLEPLQVHYQLLDGAQQVIHEGELVTLSELARYDAVAIGAVRALVSEPATYYFSLPTTVARVRFTCQQPGAAIVAYTRPLDAPRAFRLPEEAGLFEQLEDIGRTWFVFRPTHYLRRMADNRCAQITVQSRPVQANESLASGDYTWEDHQPREFAAGRFVLTRRDSQFALRDDAIVAAYYEIPLNRTVTVNWQTDDPTSLFEPKLVYRLAERNERPIRVFINDSLEYEFIPRALRGEVSLPLRAYSPEPDRLRIDAAGAIQVYMRNVQLDGAPCYIKRFVYQVDERPLTFEVVKHTAAAEQVLLRACVPLPDKLESGQPTSDVGRPDDSPPRATICVRVLDSRRPGPGPLPGWTLERRVFEIALGDDEPGLLFEGTLVDVDQGRICPLVLGEDLPPGPYTLEVRAGEASVGPVFVSLYRIRPPDPSRREANLSEWRAPQPLDPRPHTLDPLTSPVAEEGP